MQTDFMRDIMFGELLEEDQILHDMTGSSKKDVIGELVGLLSKKKLIKNKSETLKRVLERENLVSTALGDSVAIPHARLEVGEKPIIAMGRHSFGIDFDSPDKKPVHLIILVLWAPERAGLFNRLFAGLVKKLADAKFRNDLMVSVDAKDLACKLSNVRINMQAGYPTKCETDMLVMLQQLETNRQNGIKGLEKQISLVREELPGSILSRFDRLIGRYGTALVEAPTGVCAGCNIQLSSKFASEMLKNSDSIYICEKCGRFLIHHIS